VEFSTSHLERADLIAMARYLKALPQRGDDRAPPRPDATTMRTGQAIFIDACAGCHRTDGKAAPRAFAPLADSAVVQADSPTSVVRLILEGTHAAVTDASATPFA